MQDIVSIKFLVISPDVYLGCSFLEVHMQFANLSVETLLSKCQGLSEERVNVFAAGKDDSKQLICICPNKDSARAIQSLLSIAQEAHNLQVVNACITSHCYLSPKILADGSLGMVAIVINDALYVDGDELEYNEPELQLGTSEYLHFASGLLGLQRKEGRK
jgi:hypothetical protein